MNPKLLVLTIMLILTSCQKGEEELVVVPKNFTGTILVIYNQKSGHPILYQEGKRVLVIPENGILTTSCTPNTDWSRPIQFYYGTIAPEHEIPNFDNNKNFNQNLNNIPQDVVGAFDVMLGSITKVLPNGNQEKIIFSQFLICTKKDLAHYRQQARQINIDELVDAYELP